MFSPQQLRPRELWAHMQRIGLLRYFAYTTIGFLLGALIVLVVNRLWPARTHSWAFSDLYWLLPSGLILTVWNWWSARSAGRLTKPVALPNLPPAAPKNAP